jgi:dihydrofolate reductase
MRKVALSMLITLDGFIAGPNGELDWAMGVWEEGFQRDNIDEFRSADAFLYGRVAYQKTGKANVEDLGPVTKLTTEWVNLLNNMKKYVFSRTLRSVNDNAVIIKGNIEEEVLKLKNQPGKDLLLVCGPELLATFIKLNLIDEYRIGVVPIVIGGGKPLFRDVRDRLDLKLIKTKTFDSGLVMSYYQPATRLSPKAP